jgi:hypothetical protein
MTIVTRSNARTRAVAAGLGLTLVVGLVGTSAPVLAGDPERRPSPPPGLRTFMEALAAVESGGRYEAVNRTSGAIGRYQVMPSNWPAWARRYLGDAKAKPTPRNQDRVAGGRLSDLYWAKGRWDRVAYWWLTGKSGARSGWSAFATRYVDKVVNGFRRRLATPAPGGTRVVGDRSLAIRWGGRWGDAASPHYTGGHAKASRLPGSRAILQFTGKAVRVEGPTGPTRGKVVVYVDGRRARTVSLHGSTFRARQVLYKASWKRRGSHRVVVRVLEAPKGRRTVAIDRFVVRG